MQKYLLFGISLLMILGWGCQQEKEPEKPYVVILSLDGFRWDYPELAHTPVLDSLGRKGVKAVSMKASFPTKTFPNHYTLATGLYPDHHGIVANSFHADDLGRYYSLSDRKAVTDGAFYGGEPLWVTAETQGVRTATLFWVGASAEIRGVRPSTWYVYDGSIPYAGRIDSISAWLQKPGQERPHLIMWYLDEPDHTGHEYGPQHDSTIRQVEALDRLLGSYFHQMRKLPVFDQINFIITSDHGMTETTNDRLILIDQYIDTADIEYMDGSNPNLNIKVKPGKLEEVYQALSQVPHLFAWRSDSVPERLHYGKNPRTHDICVVAYPGWAIGTTDRPTTPAGSHGYDNAFKDMHAIFYAAGPAFAENYEHPEFENVNVYPLVTEILGIVPAKTDGSLGNVESMLREK